MSRSMIDSSRSLGIVMTVSTHSRSDSRPFSACTWRFLPFELERLGDHGDGQRAELAGEAGDDGRRAGPVPPPSPVVTNTMSAPPSAGISLSVSSSAAWRPTFGSAPAPRPLVSLPPICSFTGAGFELQRLQVGVGDDELDAVEPGLHHAVHGIAAAAAHADHLDARACARAPRPA